MRGARSRALSARWHALRDAAPGRVRVLLRHGDFLSLLLLLIAVASVWAFVELADEVREGGLQGLDTRILYWLRDPMDTTRPIGPRWLAEAIRDASALGSVTVLALLVSATAAALWLEKHRPAAVWLVMAALGATGLSTLFKLFFARERPDLIAPELLPTSYSFPSGHSALSATVYLTLGAALTRVVPRASTRALVLATALLLTLFTGVSRVYLGVHYPSDVLAGWTLGLGWAALCWLIAWNIEKR